MHAKAARHPYSKSFNLTRQTLLLGALCSKGVLVGNWTEERSASATEGRGPFQGQSTSNSTYGAQVVALKHQIRCVGFGHGIRLLQAHPSDSVRPTTTQLTVAQLSCSHAQASPLKPDVQAGSVSGLNERKYGQRLHACSGKDTILRHEEPHSRSMMSDGLASISQLTYSAHSLPT